MKKSLSSYPFSTNISTILIQIVGGSLDALEVYKFEWLRGKMHCHFSQFQVCSRPWYCPQCCTKTC
jgi:hypothetical protein